MPSGWKSLAGAAIAVLSGFAIIFIDKTKFEIGLGFISAGILGLGIAHKIEKGSK